MYFMCNRVNHTCMKRTIDILIYSWGITQTSKLANILSYSWALIQTWKLGCWFYYDNLLQFLTGQKCLMFFIEWIDWNENQRRLKSPCHYFQNQFGVCSQSSWLMEFMYIQNLNSKKLHLWEKDLHAEIGKKNKK